MNRVSVALFLAMLAFAGCTTSITDETNVITTSRASCVKIFSNTNTAKGSGFFLDAEYVATCFHVIADISVTSNANKEIQINYDLHPDLVVETGDGERLQATCVSIPNQADPTPLVRDFAILKLKKKPKTTIQAILLVKQQTTPNVGDVVVFSGYPLSSPTMLTHRGMISGIATQRNLLCLQAPVNKGSSGSAVLNREGKVLAIVTSREGGISQDLDNLRKYIVKTEKKGGISIMGVNPLQASKEIINVLDRNISTGIGYGNDIRFLSDYISKHNILKKN